MCCQLHHTPWGYRASPGGRPDSHAVLSGDLPEPTPNVTREGAARLDKTEPWTAEAVEATLRGLQQEQGLKPKTAFQPVRLAITGRLVSPPLFESMELLGKARSLARLERAASTRLSDPPAGR